MLTSSNPIAFNSYERSIEQAVYILVYSRYQLRAENLDSRFLWKMLEERENKNREKIMKFLFKICMLFLFDINIYETVSSKRRSLCSCCLSN